MRVLSVLFATLLYSISAIAYDEVHYIDNYAMNEEYNSLESEDIEEPEDYTSYIAAIFYSDYVNGGYGMN
jgi:hypothetical protein